MTARSPRDRILLAVRLLGGQRNLARAMGLHDDGRDVRRWVAGEREPSAEQVARAREAVATRGREIEEALREWAKRKESEDCE